MKTFNGPQDIAATHSKQFPVQIREPEYKANEYWFWHDETDTIRSVSNSDMVLAFVDTGLKEGAMAVAKPWTGADDQ